MNCPKCNLKNSEDSKFCQMCGAELEENKEQQISDTNINCPKCNSQNSKDSRFCQVCGAQLVDSSEQKAAKFNNTYVSSVDTDTIKKKIPKPFVIVAGIIVFAIIVMGIIPSGSNKVIFCTSVDKDLKPIGEGKSFSTGNLTVELESSKSFDTDKIKLALYKLNGTSKQTFDVSEKNVDPESDVLACTINLKEKGEYEVDFIKNGKDKLGSGTVSIK